ncbi:conserved hypothetical protein [Thiobacillus denitrificans ATCC 25259]|uniref:DUF748 domain-containing protein n=1 Tax=Thiobacillus denitrificans (strain ATCC 25259 / T1) TaxID=292415 RepID=Q3SGZ4_THIDA|nr:DUF748 domain-containing protein [Thiobacillus denitrificans]AAZ98099.1 conserved hypothetical protein [Thiobacillus denitrificans ATCC 25259]
MAAVRERLRKIALSLPTLIVAGLFVLYLVTGFFLVDPLAQKLLPWIGEDKLASRLSARRVTFNPLTLEATVEGLKLAEKSGAPLASFERLYLDLDSTGLFRWAWRIRDIDLVQPHATVEVRRGGTLNWAALIARLREDEKPPSETMVRLLVDHIRIADGRVAYRDANRAGEPFTALLEPLGIELDGLSTLPEDRGAYLLAARLPAQGGTVKWKGDLALNPLASRGEIGLEGVRLAKLLSVVKSPRNFDLPSGTLAASLRYRFAMVQNAAGDDAPWVRVDGANLVVRDLTLAPRDGGVPALQLAEARVADANFDLATRAIQVARISLDGAKLAATRDARGVLDWQALFGPAPEAAPRPAAAKPAAPAPPWKIGVREIKLSGWGARFTDQGFVTPLVVTAEGFGLTAALTGEVGAKNAVDIGPVAAALGPVRILSGSQQVAELRHAALVNAGVHLADQRIDIEALELNAARTTVSLDRKKRLNWADILERKPPAPSASVPTAAATAADTEQVKEKATPMALHLGRLGLNDIAVEVVDRSPPTPVRLDVAEGFVTFEDLSLDMDKAVPLEAGFALRQGGRVAASGTVIPAAGSGRIDVRLSGLSLEPLAPYVNQLAFLHLRSGDVSTRGKLVFSRAADGTKLAYRGGFAVDDLAVTEEETEEAFVGWRKLSSDSLDLRLNPNRLHMNELVALNPFGKVIIFEDATMNLQRIVRASKASKPAPKAKPAASTPQGESFPLSVGRLRITGANAEFADLSLTPQFGTVMHDLGGVVTGLSNDPATTAQVELDGKVDDYGSARVRGVIQPFRATDFTDLTLSFRNLEMTRMTSYSGKFAGRKIDSGKLSVDLEYKIKDRQLTGQNKFVVNTLKLGERVDSPNAIRLPLDLAIALLEDSNGVIDLDLPVSGSLDDPQFSYGKIVWKALVNVLTRIVTAPFRALGKLLGVSAEKLEAVGFDPGSSVLLPPEQEKLKTLVEALAKRPALGLTLEPGYDPEADRRARQEQAMRADALAAAGIKLAPGEAPGPVDVNNFRIQTWLEDRYAESAGKDAYRKLRASFQDKNVGAAARVLESQLVERLGRRFKTRDTGPLSPFHAELLERLTRQVEIPDAALVELAQARGEAVRAALVAQGLDAGRLAVAAPSTQAAADQRVPSKMNLDARRVRAPEAAPAAAAP